MGDQSTARILPPSNNRYKPQTGFHTRDLSVWDLKQWTVLSA